MSTNTSKTSSAKNVRIICRTRGMFLRISIFMTVFSARFKASTICPV